MTQDQKLAALESRIERMIESVERQAHAVTVLDLHLHDTERQALVVMNRIERHLYAAAVALTHSANVRNTSEFAESIAVVAITEAVQP